MAKIEQLGGTAFLAFPEMKNLLVAELKERFGLSDLSEDENLFVSESGEKSYGDLLYLPDFAPEKDENGNLILPYWARTCMLNPFLLDFDSIGEAASELKKIQRNWAGYNFQFFRRASLIQEKLPYINLKTRKFPCKIPTSPIGLFTLLDDKKMIASAQTSSFLPAGKIEFEEDHENPPSRAYLKLEESLTYFSSFMGGELPNENSKCFEAGACPGGWTWVLRQLGAEVFAVDRAELAPSLMNDSKVKFLAHDAFTLKPEDVCHEMKCEKLDFVLSDVICYPERLLEWIEMWLDSKRAKNIICTIKMQGKIDWNLISKFAAIPNSRIFHLNYNKHELTIIISKADTAFPDKRSS